MDNEAYRDFTHREAIEYLHREFLSRGARVWIERKLPNEAKADVLIWTPQSEFQILEVKTYFSLPELHDAWNKYSPYCQRLFMVYTRFPFDGTQGCEWSERVEAHYRPIGAQHLTRYSYWTLIPAQFRHIPEHRVATLKRWLR